MTPKAMSEDQLHQLFAYLAGEASFAFFETTRVSAEDHRSLLFTRPKARLLLTAADRPEDFFAAMQKYLDQGLYLAGWCAYEFGYRLEPVLTSLLPVAEDLVLADFEVFDTPRIFDHRRGCFVSSGLDSLPVDDCFSAQASGAPVLKNLNGSSKVANEKKSAEAGDGFQVTNVRLSQPRNLYEENVRKIRAYIAAGDTYQVNYTLKLLFDLTGSAEALYLALRRNQSVGFGAMLKNGRQQVLSFSPELFFRKQGDRITVRPMKGTVRRGRTVGEDGGLANFLQSDIKNRSENVMIVDLLRNDLGRICQLGSVATTSLFDVETYETLHQMTSTVTGTLTAGVSLRDLFAGLFPCGSVTGAPKIRTMQIIRELERGWRGVYTGAVGYLAPGGEMVFNVPIRTVVLDGGQGEMGIGSGVVYDSEPAAEWDECLLKGRFLLDPAPAFELIETLCWQESNGYWLLDLHLDRLCASAQFFGFAVDRRGVAEALMAYAAALAAGEAWRVRLLLRKDGSIALTHAAMAPPVQGIPEALPAGSLPLVTIACEPVDSRRPELYHKTTRRGLYDRHREEALAKGLYEVLFVNERGELTEGAITNLFLRRGESLVTPPVTCGLLAGVLRRHLLENGPCPMREEIIRPADLLSADAIYCGNSVRGLVQVRLADDGSA